MDKGNGKVTDIELEMAIEEKERLIPYAIKENQIITQLLWDKYSSLIGHGFSEEQAMRIICERPAIED